MKRELKRQIKQLEKDLHSLKALCDQEDQDSSVYKKLQDIMETKEEYLYDLSQELEEEEVSGLSPAKQYLLVAKAKGLPIEDNGTVPYHMSVKIGSFESESFEKAAIASDAPKRSAENYHPSPAQLSQINKMARIDFQPEQLYVFKLAASNTNTDRDGESFNEEALKDMARLSPGSPLMFDHSNSAKDIVGKLFSANVHNGILYQDIYVINSPENQPLINKIFAGLFDKVSVRGLADAKDYQCNLCNVSMYSRSCPHEKPGEMDMRAGKAVTATYTGVKMYAETSIVAIPANKDADFLNKSADEFSEAGDKFNKSILSFADYMQAHPEVLEQIQKNLSAQRPETLINPEKILADIAEINKENENPDIIKNEKGLIEGDSPVSDQVPTPQPEAEVAEKAPEAAEKVEEKEVAPAAEQKEAEKSAPVADAEVEKINEALLTAVKSLTDSVSKLETVLAKNSEDLNKLMTAQKSITEAQEGLAEVVATAMSTSVDEIAKKVMANSNPAQKADAPNGLLVNIGKALDNSR